MVFKMSQEFPTASLDMTHKNKINKLLQQQSRTTYCMIWNGHFVAYYKYTPFFTKHESQSVLILILAQNKENRSVSVLRLHLSQLSDAESIKHVLIKSKTASRSILCICSDEIVTYFQVYYPRVRARVASAGYMPSAGNTNDTVHYDSLQHGFELFSLLIAMALLFNQKR